MSTIIEQPRYSCALSALQTVLAIPRALPIVHAGPGCASKAFGAVAGAAGYQGEGFGGGAAVTCTNTGEEDVVFGGENKLRKTIEGALKVLDGDLFVVVSGCTSDIVGDDSIHVAEEYRKKGYPIVGTETAGFKGNNYYGHEIVERAIIEEFVGDVEPQVRKGLVNVFSVVPYQDPFWRGDLQEIKGLLKGIGLEVNILYGYESKGVSEWKDIPNAQFNLVLSPWMGVDIGELLKKKYETPYLHYQVLPVGAQETSQFLRTVGEFAGLPKEQVETVITKEEDVFYQYLISITDFIADLRNNLPHEFYTVADSAYALGTSKFLVEELGFIPRGVYIIDDAQGKNAKLIEKAVDGLGKEFQGLVRIEADGGHIEKDIRSKINSGKKSLLLGSTWEKNLAAETASEHLFLSIPINDGVVVNRTYLGYKGGLRLLEDIYDGIFKNGNIARTTLTTLG
ncbi:nitrogenase molybdenum-iron protein beta chain [Kineothrix alysoides]|uniref:Nitrogenase molybdenum-iron protein beta chain n=1 Tax=Kineothrix alysoides TaxID=1469948 RepID=A0A4V2QCF1_9FIRM|nr:nitrogenase component 1 [Kineothrix alysoides]TCL60017.1 nitrogenase molybdenum-iron protein beta chain [Kineothrix alysoides]